MTTKKRNTALARAAGILAAFLAVIFVASCLSSGGGGVPAKGTAIPLAPDILTGKLPNGITYFIRPNRYPEGRAYLYLAVAAGSVDEDDSQQGLAHFLEHMAFNGTEHFPENELVGYLQSLGMRFGPEVNASTSFDRTVYTLEALTDNPASVDTALTVLEDWATGITLDPAQVEGERSVIHEEWRLSGGPQERLFRKQAPLIWEGARQAKRLPIGDPEIILKAPVSELKRFYEDWYRPENMTVIAVGDFDPAEMEKKLMEAFKDPIPKRPARAKPSRSVPGPVAGRVVFSAETDPELSYAQFQLMYRLPDAPPAGTVEEYRSSILSGLISGMAATRLGEGARDPKSPYAYATASLRYLSPERNAFMLTAVPKPGRTAECLDAILLAKEKMVRGGFSGEEIKAQKAELLSFFEQLANDSQKNESGDLARELVRHAIEAEAVPGIVWEHEHVKAYFAELTDEEVNAAAKAMFAAEDLTALFAAPDSRAAELPGKDAFLAAMKKAAGTEVAAAVDAAPPKPLMEKAPAPGKIVSEEKVDAVGVTIWTLSNGAKVLLKPTKFKNDEIAFNALALGGTSRSSDADFYSALLANNLASYSGLGELTATELERSLKGKAAGASRSISVYTHGLSGSSGVKDAETLFQLINLHFTGSRVDSVAADAALEAIKANLLDQEKDPDTVYSLTMTETMSGRHPRYMRLRPVNLAAVDKGKALAFIGDSYNAGDFLFSFSGNVDLAAFRKLVEAYIASIPQPKKGLAWKDLGVERPSGVDVSVRKGSDPKSLVTMTWFAPDSYTYGKFLRTRVLTELLDMKLNEEVRERLGGAYSIGSAAYYNSIPSSEVVLTVEFGCDPARVEELSAAAWGEIEKIRKGDIAPSDLAKAKEMLKNAMESDFERNEVWASTLNQLILVRKQPLDVVVGYKEGIDAISAADLAALASLFEAGSRNRVTLYPEK